MKDDPQWYRTWRHDAVHQLQAKNAHVAAEFRLGQWCRFDYDLDAGTLTFSENVTPKVIAKISVVGSTDATTGTWLWAWANPQIPANLVAHAQLARAFGEKHGVLELTTASFSDESPDDLGWELSAVAVRVGNALGAYGVPLPSGGLYLSYESIEWMP